VAGIVADLIYLLRLVLALAAIVGGVGWLIVHLPIHPVIIVLACMPWVLALLGLVQP
jgi:hypothetical protein